MSATLSRQAIRSDNPLGHRAEKDVRPAPEPKTMIDLCHRTNRNPDAEKWQGQLDELADERVL